MSVTKTGAIAYRLDAIAGDLFRYADNHELPVIAECARKLWGAMDDLVALGMAERALADDLAAVLATVKTMYGVERAPIDRVLARYREARR